MPFRTSFLALAVCLFAASPALAADYYVSLSGNDANPGTLAAPWQTLARVNTVDLEPGDRVLLRAGDTFDGRLVLDTFDGGTAAAPVTIESYGAGRATIRSAARSAINAYNVAGIRVQNLTIVGDGTGSSSGIVFYTDAGTKLPFVRIDNVEVSGYGKDGIEVGSWNGTAGFRDVRITRAWTHRNARTGILFYAQAPLAHENVYVGYSRAFDNPGIPTSTTNSGSGIVLGGVNGGTVEWSIASGNGRLNTAVGGPVGIWTYDSARVVIQYNEAYGNRTASTADGGGFDLDQNVSESVIQYNYSHDNDGAGYLLAHSPNTAAHIGNIVRFNVSENDGRKNSYAGIELWGRITDARIHNNTVRMSPAAVGRPVAVRVWNAGVEDRIATKILFQHNVFVTTGGSPIVHVTPQQASTTNVRFDSNLYHSSGDVFAIVWNDSTYGSLNAWRSTGQETNSDGIATGAEGPVPAMLPPADIVLNAARATNIVGAWRKVADTSAASGERLWHPNAGAAKVVTAQPSPANAFDLTFQARAGRPYRLWMRLAAEGNHWSNDSVFAQFSNATDSAGAPSWQLGSSSALELNLEECGGCGVAGWGWQDTGYGSGVLGPVVYFAADGPQTIRVQTREDGVSVDQIVLSEVRFMQTAPGRNKYDSTAVPVGPTMPDSAWTPAPSTTEPVESTIEPPATEPPATEPSPTEPTAPAPVEEVVIYATDVLPTTVHGDWKLVADTTAAAGFALWNPNRGAAKLGVQAQPLTYFDVTFKADAGVDYHVWVRLRADDDSYLNDSFTLQFSGAVASDGTRVAQIGTTSGFTVVLQDTNGAPISGWGWNDTGWAGMALPVRFGQTGDQTLRIQQREDGLRIDQIIISARRYLGTSPGTLTNDGTIVAK